MFLKSGGFAPLFKNNQRNPLSPLGRRGRE